MKIYLTIPELTITHEVPASPHVSLYISVEETNEIVEGEQVDWAISMLVQALPGSLLKIGIGPPTPQPKAMN